MRNEVIYTHVKQTPVLSFRVLCGLRTIWNNKQPARNSQREGRRFFFSGMCGYGWGLLRRLRGPNVIPRPGVPSHMLDGIIFLLLTKTKSWNKKHDLSTPDYVYLKSIAWCWWVTAFSFLPLPFDPDVLDHGLVELADVDVPGGGVQTQLQFTLRYLQ